MLRSPQKKHYPGPTRMGHKTTHLVVKGPKSSCG